MEFWQAYEIAFTMTELHPDFDLIEMRRLQAADQARISQDNEVLLSQAISEKYILAMRLMFDLLT